MRMFAVKLCCATTSSSS